MLYFRCFKHHGSQPYHSHGAFSACAQPQITEQDEVQGHHPKNRILPDSRLVFIRSSQIHELITYRFNFNSYLLFVVGVPAILGLFISKSAGRPFRFPQAYLWMAFSLWIVAIIPFSIWKAGSLQMVEDYWRTNVILFVLIGGLTTTWEEFKLLLRVLAFSCVVNLIIIKVFGQLDWQDRMSLPFGALANSNDYAAHLLMLLPCLLWVALTAKSIKFRIILLAAFGYGLFAVLSSASRGALVAVSVGIVYFLFSASKKQRIWAAGSGGDHVVCGFQCDVAASDSTNAFFFEKQ